MQFKPHKILSMVNENELSALESHDNIGMAYTITTDTLFPLLVTNQSLLAISCSSVIIAHGNIEAQKSIPDYLSYSYMDLYFREQNIDN